jgi:hypothetical protein
VDEALRGGQLSGQGGARGPLIVQSQGRGALALLGGGNGSLDGGAGGDESGRRRCSGQRGWGSLRPHGVVGGKNPVGSERSVGGWPGGREKLNWL